MDASLTDKRELLAHVSTSILLDWCKGHVQKETNSEFLTIPTSVIDDHAIIVILDLSGYTRATQLLMEQAEEKHVGALDSFNASQYVGKLVKFCLDPLLQLVNVFGGDMFNYGGDALFCIWRESNESYTLQVTKALQCCIEATKWVRQHPLLDFDDKTIPLAVHTVIHACQVEMLHLGDSYLNRLECIAYGDEYFYACNLLSFAKQDEIVITNSTLNLIDISTFASVSIQRHTDDFHVLSVNVKSKPMTLPVPTELLHEQLVSFLSEEQIAYISKLYIDSAILHRPLGTAEIRQASIAFIRLRYQGGSVSFPWSVNDLLITTLQTCHPNATGVPLGILRQISQDDKGLSIMLLFGLPPATSENPTLTAACVCLKLLNTIKLQKKPFQASCGLGTGRIFSGCIRNENRMRLEHAVLGQAVNLAARFTALAEEGTILCDEMTKDMLSNADALVSIEPLPSPLQIKGYQNPVPAWKLLEGRFFDSDSKEQSPSTNILPLVQSVVFHDPKEDLIWQNFIAARNEASTVSVRTFTIEGPTGAGKSFTASRICQFCLNDGFTVWPVPTFEIEQSTSFSCVKHLLKFTHRLFVKNDVCRQLLESAEDKYPEKQGFDLICAALGILTKHESVIRDLQKFVLSTVTASSVQGSTAVPTTSLSGISNASPDNILQAATETVTALLNALVNIMDLLIVFDDCQWLDRYSWAILSAIHVQCPKLFTICISRPPKEYSDPKLQSLYVMLTQSNATHHITVGTITAERTKAIVQTKFPQLPIGQAEELTRRLVEMSSGNAFALDVLLRHIETNLSTNELADSVLAVLPKDAKAVFVSQLDNLDPTFQSMVRTAALIGQVFKLSDLLALCEMPQESLSEMQSKIMDWDKFGFMEPLEENKWRFKHYLISFQISSLMTSEERNQKLRKMAEYFESVLRLPERRLRKTELLPLLSGLYHRLGKKDDAYRIDCKLLSLYQKQHMAFECRKVLLALMEDKKRFNSLTEHQSEKIYLIGLSIANVLGDITLMHLFLRPFSKAYGNIALKKCVLFSLFQLIGAINKLDSHYDEVRKTGKWPNIEDKRTEIEKKRYNTFIRTIAAGPEFPHDLSLTLHLQTTKVISETELFILNESFEQRTENLLMVVGTFYLFDKYENAIHLRDYLGVASLDPDKPFMKMIAKYEIMSSSQLEKVSYGFLSLTHFNGPYYLCFETNNLTGYKVFQMFWKIACRHQNVRLQESAMYLFPSIATKWIEGALSAQDPILTHCRAFRKISEEQPAFSPDVNNACTVLSCSLLHGAEVYFALLNPDLYSSELKDVAITLSDINFAEQYVRMRAPSLKCHQNELMLQYASSPRLMYFYLVRGDYALAVDHLERSCSCLIRLPGALQLFYAGSTCELFVNFYLAMAFRCNASETGELDEKLYRSALKTLLAFLSNFISLFLKNKSKWRCWNILKISYYQMCTIREAMKANSYAGCLLVAKHAEKALECSTRTNSQKGQILFHELSMYMKAGVLPRKAMQKSDTNLTKDQITQCKEHYQSLRQLYAKMNALWSPLCVQRIAKIQGLTE